MRTLSMLGMLGTLGALAALFAACSQPLPIVADPVAASKAPAPPAASEAPQKADPCTRIEGAGCYWMENTTGNYCWVHAPYDGATKAECFSLDSCDGGKGTSGGGCYKWADCSHCTRAAW